MKTLILLLLLTTGNVTASPVQFITKIFNSAIAPIVENYPQTFEVRRRSVRRMRRTTRRAPNPQRHVWWRWRWRWIPTDNCITRTWGLYVFTHKIFQ